MSLQSSLYVLLGQDRPSAALRKSVLLVRVPVAVGVPVLLSLALIEAELKSIAMRVPGIGALPAMGPDLFGAAPVILLVPLVLAPGARLWPAKGHEKVASLLFPLSHSSSHSCSRIRPVTGYEQNEDRCACQVSRNRQGRS